MQSFQDGAGREWTVAVNVDAVKRVRKAPELQVDLLQVVDGQSDLLDRLASDPVLLCDVLYCVCQPEAESRGVSSEDFGRALAGDAIGAATRAFLEALVDFFPKERREPLRVALQKMRRAESLAAEGLLRRLQAPEVDAKLTAAVNRLTEQASRALHDGLDGLGA